MTSNKLPSKQQQILESTQRVETILIGVPGTAETGLVGDFKQHHKDHEALEKTVGDHSSAIARLAALHENDSGPSKKKKLGLWGGIGSIIAAIIYGLIQLFKNGKGTP